MKHATSDSQSSSPLSSTDLHVSIKDLVAEYGVHHHFENKGKDSIEAVFTFPVPLDAAFMGMTATFAGECLIAEILPKHKADRAYDDALADGNSAVLISQPEPGVLCINLGNLLPGEIAEIELRFATSLRVADRTARFSLPLVHRPRFGQWRLEDLEKPTANFLVEHPMSAKITVEGLLASAPVSCTTHAARFASTEKGMELSIAHAMLDRDLVLSFELSENISTIARLIEDGDAMIGLLTFVLSQHETSNNPLDLCLVLDGSGSMQGDAITQSREATLAIVDALTPKDRIQVLRFGNNVFPMFRRPLLATQRVQSAIRELTPTINAELGGTEMGDALESALEGFGDEEQGRSRAIILVTDGAVQPSDIAKAKALAERLVIRIFVVAVGSSAGVEVLKPLAEATKAVLERAVPAEPIDSVVMRQFRRAREAGPATLRIQWPSKSAKAIDTGIFYPGDAAFVAALLPNILDENRPVVEAWSFSGIRSFCDKPEFEACGAEPAQRALLGQLQYHAAPLSQREAIALKYGLLTNETSAVLVKMRAEGEVGNELPRIVQIPQMVSDGMVDAPLFSRRPMPAPIKLNRSIGAPDYDSMLLKPSIATERYEKINEIEVSYKNVVPTKLPFISASVARVVCNAIYDALITDLPSFEKSIPSLSEILLKLPSNEQVDAQRIMDECLFFESELHDSIMVFLALNEVLAKPAFTDEEEAIISLAIGKFTNHPDNIHIVDMGVGIVGGLLKNILQNGLASK